MTDPQNWVDVVNRLSYLTMMLEANQRQIDELIRRLDRVETSDLIASLDLTEPDLLDLSQPDKLPDRQQPDQTATPDKTTSRSAPTHTLTAESSTASTLGDGGMVSD